MTIATLVKITANRKLMMKISEKTYDMISARLTAECKKKNFPQDRLATFSLENDDGEENYFVMISLDRYDKQNMRKFELLLKKDVAIQYRMKPYDFIPDGEDEQRCGINLELISIRQYKPKITIESDQKMPSKDKIKWNSDLNKFELPDVNSDSEIDEIADKAAARAITPAKELNAEEQAIDEDVEKKAEMKLVRALDTFAAKHGEKAKQVAQEAWDEYHNEEAIAARAAAQVIADCAEKVPPPPVLERQDAAPRRRRTVPAKEASLTALEAQMKALEAEEE